MDLNKKEFLMDVLTLVGNLIVIGLITWLVFYKDISPWWYLLMVIVHFKFTPQEYVKKHD